jgi:diguanylate cyclase (GGDEF)-like protein/PAS domain S-box-containing protein
MGAAAPEADNTRARMPTANVIAAVEGDHCDAQRFGALRSPAEPVARRILAALFLGGALLALAWELSPHTDPHGASLDDLGVSGCVGAALAIGLALLGPLRRAPNALLPVLVGLASTVVITPAIYFTGSTTSAFCLFYLWAALYAYYFFTLPQAVVQTALIGLSYAVVLVLLPGRLGADEITRWALLVATTLVAGGLVRALTEGLRTSAHGYRLVFELNPHPMWVFDPDRLSFLAVNQAAVTSYGYSREEFASMTLRDIRPSEDMPELERALGQARAEARHQGCYRHRTKAGAVIEVEITSDAVPWAGREARLVTAVDVTARRRAERELRHRAEHDDLTGLLNRRGFEQEATRAVDRAAAEGTVCSLLLIDLDHFKFVNDSFGHAAGDDLIRRVAQALPERLRSQDLLARLGGDEFAIMLAGADREVAIVVASALIEHLRGTVRQGLRPVTGSVGVATRDADKCATARDMLVAADIALYDAKDAGRDRFAVAGGPGLTWVEEVREAIESERLVVLAQPILNLRTGAVDREELLVRMVDEAGELIPPASFIPTAERFGLIQQLDRWVVRRAIELVRAGRAVEVNLSAHSIGDREITRMVARAFPEQRDAERLVFEITETAAAANFTHVRDFAERVSRIGCGFALDDFGTGFGSFSYLKHVPVSYLKIDMDFVRDLSTSPADRRVVRAIVNIAEGLGQQTIAEGVEDAETLELLRSFGVHFAQGYHVGRPASLVASAGVGAGAGGGSGVESSAASGGESSAASDGEPDPSTPDGLVPAAG